MNNILLQIKAPHFTAGIILDKNNKIIKTAPILAWSLEKDFFNLKNYFNKKKWEIIIIEEF